jgi:hypothetical protein
MECTAFPVPLNASPSNIQVPGIRGRPDKSLESFAPSPTGEYIAFLLGGGACALRTLSDLAAMLVLALLERNLAHPIIDHTVFQYRLISFPSSDC